MYLFVAIFLVISAFLMVGAGFWILFFTKQVKVNFLRRYLLLGPWLTTLKNILGLKPKENYLKGWAKNLLGLFLLVAGLAILYAIWFALKDGLIVI